MMLSNSLNHLKNMCNVKVFFFLKVKLSYLASHECKENASSDICVHALLASKLL